MAISLRMNSGPLTPNDLEVVAIEESEALEFLSNAPNASWRQFPAYSKVAAQVIKASSRYALVKDDREPIAVANLRLKQLPVIGGGIVLLSQGPVLLVDTPSVHARALEALAHQLVCEQKLTLRIDPSLKHHSLTSFPSPLFKPQKADGYETFLLDISRSDEAIRSGFNGKWRADLRRAERSDISITCSTDRQDFELFHPILDRLAKAKGFSSPQDAKFFAKVAESAVEPEKVAIHLAWHKGRVIGGHVGAFSGNPAVYLLGATTTEGRDLRASFLLQWAAIRYAKSLGLRTYDLGGINKAANSNVYRFKARMGGELYLGQPMQEARAPFPLGQVTAIAENIHTRLKG